MADVLWLTSAVYLDQDATFFHLFIPGQFVEDTRTGDEGEVIGYGDTWIVVRWNGDNVEETFHTFALENFKIVGIR